MEEEGQGGGRTALYFVDEDAVRDECALCRVRAGDERSADGRRDEKEEDAGDGGSPSRRAQHYRRQHRASPSSSSSSLRDRAGLRPSCALDSAVFVDNVVLGRANA